MQDPRLTEQRNPRSSRIDELDALGIVDLINAEDGMVAWSTIKDHTPDLVILDMKMPGYHGLEVMNRMVDAHITIPLIICSAYDQLSEEFVVATYPNYR